MCFAPCYFMIYINDLPQSTTAHSSLLMFADDSKCLQVIHSPKDSKLLLNDINMWSKKWSLLFNTSKNPSLMRFVRSISSTDFAYSIEDEHIFSSHTHKDLGVTFCQDLSWSAHYSVTIAKAYRSRRKSYQTNFLLWLNCIPETALSAFGSISPNILLASMASKTSQRH